MRRLLALFAFLLLLPVLATAQVLSFHSFDYHGEPNVYLLNTTADAAGTN